MQLKMYVKLAVQKNNGKLLKLAVKQHSCILLKLAVEHYPKHNVYKTHFGCNRLKHKEYIYIYHFFPRFTSLRI